MAEGGGLLNRYRVKSSIGGSNPPLSASYLKVNHLAHLLITTAILVLLTSNRSGAQVEHKYLLNSQEFGHGPPENLRMAAIPSGPLVLM